MIVTRLVLGPFPGELLHRLRSCERATVVVDPGSDGDRVIAEIERTGRELDASG
jgi:hypothetical protein